MRFDTMNVIAFPFILLAIAIVVLCLRVSSLVMSCFLRNYFSGAKACEDRERKFPGEAG